MKNIMKNILNIYKIEIKEDGSKHMHSIGLYKLDFLIILLIIE